MRRWARGWLLLWSVVGAACRPAPRPEAWLSQVDSLQEGEVLSGRGERLSAAQWEERLWSARFILVGEQHDQGCDHRFQARVLASLAQWEEGVVVGLEQVAVPMQPVLDQFSSGQLPLGALPQALAWKKTWGVAFELYQPVFLEAQRRGARLWALNLPREVVKAYGENRLSEAQRPLLPQPLLPVPDAQRAYLEEVFQQHAPHGSGDFARFLEVQALWDTQMAARAVEGLRTHGGRVLILAGEGHVAHGWGIPSRLEQLAPGVPRLTLMPWRGKQPLAAEEADLFFYCPLPSGQSSRVGGNRDTEGRPPVTPSEVEGLQTFPRLRSEGWQK